MFNRVYRAARRYAWRGGRDLHRNLQRLELSQWWTRDELEADQLQQLRQLLAYAWSYSPYYRRCLDDSGLDPGDLTTLADLEAISPIRRAGVRENLSDLVSRDPALGKTYSQTTGGTTGEPLRFPMDAAMSWWSAAIQVRGRGWFGVEPGDRQAWLWGAPVDLPDGSLRTALKALLKRRKFHSAVELDEESLDRFAEMLLQWRPQLLRAYPAALEVFARHAQRTGIGGITPRLVETTAETLTPVQEELFREVFQAPVADCYSCRELLDVAYPCPRGRMHVAEPFLVEILNDEGAPTKGVGHVTITSLLQRSTPFIRYQPGDLGELEPTPCPCGRSMPVLARLVGRKEDMIALADGSRVEGALFNNLLSDLDEVKKYQVLQSEPGRLTLRTEMRAPVEVGWPARVAERVDDYFGGRTQTTVEIVEEIEFTGAGKIRNVISTV